MIPAMLAERIGHFRIEGPLGQGGMGEVYRGYDEKLRRRVAIKRVRAEAGDSTARERLLREAQNAARLDHPAIVRTHHVQSEGNYDYIVMEFVEGRTLAKVLSTEGALSPTHAIAFFREVAEGLTEAHARDIVHRDIKAENVMVTTSGHAKILDFGLAKRVAVTESGSTEKTLSRPGDVLGTPHAMSPEQARGDRIHHCSDLFSLGAVFYQALTNIAPFRAPNLVATLAKVMTHHPPSVAEIIPDVPAKLSELIGRLLQKEPESRPDAAEVSAALSLMETGGAGTPFSGPLQPEAMPQVDSVDTVDFRLKTWKPRSFPAEPYPLLLPYEHPELLAGRERELGTLRRRLASRTPIFGLYAPSGAGKTSLLAAGLVPAWRAEGRPVAFDRHPQEAGLAKRLIGNLLSGLADENPVVDNDPQHFLELLATVRRLSGEPPLLVLDQFEDVFSSPRSVQRDGESQTRAKLGILLASTVWDQVELDEPLCRWLLAYREGFHGKVTTWLEDVLLDARQTGAKVVDLPYDLARPERFHSWALPMLGSPPPGDDRAEVAARAFRDAIEIPLALLREDGSLRYPWRFAGNGAERLARAFADARLARRGAPLAPEFQVVLAHLLDSAGGGTGAIVEIEVPEDPERLISEALADHLREVLKNTFRAGSKATERRGRTRALLALRELAEAHGRRGEGIGASRLIAAVGKDGKEILRRLEAPGARLVVTRDDDDDPTGYRYLLAHDRLAEVIVEAVEKEGTKLAPLDRELLRLRKFVALNSELYRAQATRQATDLDQKQFRRIREHSKALLWDDERKEWWRECQRQRRERRWRWVAWSLAALAVFSLIGFRAWEWWERKAWRDSWLVELSSARGAPAFDALHFLVEDGVEPNQLAEHWRKRAPGERMEVFEVPAKDTGVARWGEARLNAIRFVLPSLRDGKSKDLELVGALVWALDDIVVREPLLSADARDLRLKVLMPFNPSQRPAVDDAAWRSIPGGTFMMGSPEGGGGDDGYPEHKVAVSSFHMLEREVTVAEYRRLVPDHPGQPEEPVVNVNWYEAYAYAAWLGGRLPTEAEWEYASRAQCDFDYCDTETNEVTLAEVAWYGDIKIGLHEPCQKKRNQFRLCDMYGNAWEWVADWYDTYTAEPVTDPWGPARSDWRVLRGGGFGDADFRMQAAYRVGVIPKLKDGNVGFRVVRRLGPERP